MALKTETLRCLSPSRLTSSGVRALMDALPSHVVLLDDQGTIVAANRAWNELAAAQGAESSRVGVGANYLAVCDQAASDLDPLGARFGDGLRRVLLGLQPCFELDDRLVIDGTAHVLRGRATRFDDPIGTWVLVTHEDLSRPAMDAA